MAAIGVAESDLVSRRAPVRRWLVPGTGAASGAVALGCLALGWTAPAAAAAAVWTILAAWMLAGRLVRPATGPAEPSPAQVFSRITEVYWVAEGGDRDRLTFVSPNCRILSGFDDTKFLAQPGLWLSRIPPADRVYVAAEAGLLRAGLTARHVYRFCRKDKEIRWVSETVVPTLDGEGRLVRAEGVAEDITNIKDLEYQLVHSQQLGALGHLSRGVAHDFNNLLTIISGNTELIESSLDDRDGVLQYLFDLRRATEQACGMVQGLLSFGRTWTARPRAVDLNQLLQDTIRVIRRAMGANISVSIDEHDNPGPVLLDPPLIRQVLLNLCLIARSAMPKGGTLVFRTDPAVISEAEASIRPEILAGRYARLRLEATPVVAAGERVRPCFSAEAVDLEGGIGLAAVYRIVQDHHGWVDLQALQGGTATVNLFLPLEETVIPAEAVQPEDVSRGEELLLLVEEVDLVASFIRTVMEMRGYRVAAAALANAAQQLFNERREEFAAAIVNVGLPDKAAPALVRWLRAVRPDLPVVLTGEAEDENQVPLFDDNRTAFLQKPFRAEQLAKAVRRVIDAKLVTGNRA